MKYTRVSDRLQGNRGSTSYVFDVMDVKNSFFLLNIFQQFFHVVNILIMLLNKWLKVLLYEIFYCEKVKTPHTKSVYENTAAFYFDTTWGRSHKLFGHHDSLKCFAYFLEATRSRLVLTGLFCGLTENLQVQLFVACCTSLNLVQKLNGVPWKCYLKPLGINLGSSADVDHVSLNICSCMFFNCLLPTFPASVSCKYMKVLYFIFYFEC